MSFNAFGKPAETVDFGGEVDYASYEWFKDPPPRSEVASFLFSLDASLTFMRSPPHLRPLRANLTSPHLPSSTRMRYVPLPSSRPPMCCSDAINSTDRCVCAYVFHSSSRPLTVDTPLPQAWRARMVRRVQRDDRRVEAAWDRRGHVRLDERGGTEGVRGCPSAAARNQDANHRDPPVVAGRAASAFPRCRTRVGGLPRYAFPPRSPRISLVIATFSHGFTFTTFLPLNSFSHFGNATGVYTYDALHLLIIYGSFLLDFFFFFFSFALCRRVMKRICLTHAPCVHSTSNVSASILPPALSPHSSTMCL